MGLLENGGLLKGSATVALWGLGIYVGLCVAAPLLTAVGKPLAKEAAKGYQSLRTRLQRAVREGAGEIEPEAEIAIAGQTAAAVVSGPPASAPAAEAAAELQPMAAVELPKPGKQPRPKAVPEAGEPSVSWSKAALYVKAKELKILGRSTMSKGELLTALQATLSPATA